MTGTADLYSRQYARHFAAKRSQAATNAEAARQREADRKAAGKPSFDERWEAALKEGGNTKRAHEIMREQERAQS